MTNHPKRGHGEGQLRKRATPAGRVYYEVNLMLGLDADGKRRTWSATAPTRKEALAKLQDAIALHRQGELPLAVRQTVREYLCHYLTIAKPNLRPTVWQSYEGLIRVHALPALGHLRLDRLQPAHLERLYAALRPQRAPQTVLNLHRVLHRALGIAVRQRLLPRNPADLLDAPRVARAEQPRLTLAQAHAFLVAAEASPLEAFFVLALLTGMRAGELLGLRWADLTWEPPTLTVRRALVRVKGIGWVEQEPKSARSRRALPLAPAVVRALHVHRAAQLSARLAAGPRWADRDLVFPNTIGRPLEPQNVQRRHFLPLLERAGLPRMRFHDLRHAFASFQFDLHTDAKTTQELLGHATVALTLDTYTHAPRAAHRAAANALADLLLPPSHTPAP